jgi:hypothetical protein
LHQLIEGLSDDDVERELRRLHRMCEVRAAARPTLAQLAYLPPEERARRLATMYFEVDPEETAELDALDLAGDTIDD